MEIPENLKEKLQRMHYGISGHGAVEICGWTKKYLRDEGSCYKRKFYGIDTHRCAQISPTPIWCQHNCIYCWRPMEFMNLNQEKNSMEPEELIKGLVEKRRKQLSGFKGNAKVNREKFNDAFNLFPSHWAISLSGEPLLYNKLGKMIKILRENKEVRSIFVVSNGQEPEALKTLNKKNLLPTQLYISVNAPNKKAYQKISAPKYRNGWERLNETLVMLRKIKTRTVIRFTQIRGINDSESWLNDYAKLLEKAQSDFLEVKAFMIIGHARKRLKIENMPSHEEVKNFAKKLEKKLSSYKIVNESEFSRVVLLKNKNSQINNLIIFNEPKYEEKDEISFEWTPYQILKKYRKVRRVLDKKGFDSWDKDHISLKEQAKRLGIKEKDIIGEINELVNKEY